MCCKLKQNIYDIRFEYLIYINVIKRKGKIDIRRKENVIYLMLKIYGID